MDCPVWTLACKHSTWETSAFFLSLNDRALLFFIFPKQILMGKMWNSLTFSRTLNRNRGNLYSSWMCSAWFHMFYFLAEGGSNLRSRFPLWVSNIVPVWSQIVSKSVCVSPPSPCRSAPFVSGFSIGPWDQLGIQSLAFSWTAFLPP